VFKDHPLESDEILPLVAYFEDAANQAGDDDSVASLNFFLIALVCSALGLALFDGIWKNRFRAVRRPMKLESDTRNRA
ncbi:MAG: hypothetical protein K8I27_11350, partial [Planctomycetes bacterium]|nr:hypothetical protein [Planctomycetota bacterium]